MLQLPRLDEEEPDRAGGVDCEAGDARIDGSASTSLLPVCITTMGAEGTDARHATRKPTQRLLDVVDDLWAKRAFRIQPEFVSNGAKQRLHVPFRRKLVSQFDDD